MDDFEGETENEDNTGDQVHEETECTCICWECVICPTLHWLTTQVDFSPTFMVAYSTEMPLEKERSLLLWFILTPKPAMKSILHPSGARGMRPYTTGARGMRHGGIFHRPVIPRGTQPVSSQTGFYPQAYLTHQSLKPVILPPFHPKVLWYQHFDLI